MGCSKSKEKYDPQMYYSPTGELVCYNPKFHHSASDEMEFVGSHDVVVMSGGDECYIITTAWLKNWISYARGNVNVSVGPITNTSLVDLNNTVKVKKNIAVKKDFRPVCKSVWEYYFNAYGGGPVIAFHVPHGLEQKAYKSGKWLEFVKLEQIAVVIYPEPCPERCSHFETTNPMNISDLIATDTAGEAVGHMMKDMGKAKMKEAKQLQADINAANAEAAGALMAKELGQAKIEEARRMEEEANKAAAEAIALQMAGDLSKRKMEEARRMEEQQREEQERRLMEMFKGMGAKARFRAALASGRDDIAESSAAEMLQGAWKSKCARRRMEAKRSEKELLRQEACARKLQSRYRARLARIRMDTLRAEKLRLMEEGCAIKLQAAWRIKKARRRAQEMKIRKQRLMEEGAALQLQAAWRIKKSKERVAGLRMERRELAGTIVVQRLWKSRRARKAWLELRRASTLVERVMRGVLARQRVSRLLRQVHPHNVIVSLKSARGLNVADATSSDPYVLVTTHRQDSAHTLKSYSKSRTIANSLNPVWNDDLLVTAVEEGLTLTLTIMDSDMIGSDDFMGQTLVDMKACRGLYAGREVAFTDASVDSYKLPISDSSGRPIVAPGTITMPGKGHISFTVRVPSLAYSMAGWMLKASTALMTKGSMKKRWMVLVDYKLSYYENQFTLHDCKGEINCADITSIVEDNSKKDGKVWKIHFGGQGRNKDSWTVRVDEGEPPHIHRMWWRKIIRSCPNVPDPELLTIDPRLCRKTIGPGGRAPLLQVGATDSR